MSDTRQSVLMVGFVSMLVAGLAYVTVWRPQAANLASASDDLAAAEAQLAAVPPPSSPSAAGTPGGEIETGAALEAAVPADPQLADLLRQLDTVATNSGVVATAVAPSRLSLDPNGALTGSISISVSGPRPAAVAYLAGLAGLPRLVVVEQVSLQDAASEATPDLVQLTLTAKVFATATATAPATAGSG